MALTFPFQLIPRMPREAAEPAHCEALLVPGVLEMITPKVLAALACAKPESADQLALYPTKHGCLIHNPAGFAQTNVAVIRLRRSSGRIFLPMDAELVPALLPDEAEALTREQGLLVLPHREPCFFHLLDELPLDTLLRTPALGRDDWSALPRTPELALKNGPVSLSYQPPESSDSDRFGAVDNVGVDPLISPEDAAKYGRAPRKKRIRRGQGSAEDQEPSGPRGASKSRSGKGKGNGKGSRGKGSGKHQEQGRSLNPITLLKRFFSRGASSIGEGLRVLSGKPRFSEPDANLIAAMQEQALRDLLQDFKDGNLDAALRRAIPVAGLPGPRGERFSPGTELGEQDTSAELANILKHEGQRSVWLGGAEVQIELAQEYRTAITASMEAGDHRRAAYIAAKLLGDYRTAADCFARGGEHREAAEIYLSMLNDYRAAAGALRQAGDLDRAASLYMAANDPAAAAACMRDVGADEQAHRLWNQHIEALLNRGQRASAASVAWKELGERERAEELYRKDVDYHGRIKPESVEGLTKLLIEGADQAKLVQHAQLLADLQGKRSNEHFALDALISVNQAANSFEHWESSARERVFDLTRITATQAVAHNISIGRRADHLIASLKHWPPAMIRDLEEAGIAMAKAIRERDARQSAERARQSRTFSSVLQSPVKHFAISANHRYAVLLASGGEWKVFHLDSSYAEQGFDRDSAPQLAQVGTRKAILFEEHHEEHTRLLYCSQTHYAKPEMHQRLMPPLNFMSYQENKLRSKVVTYDGKQVVVLEGAKLNPEITTPVDLPDPQSVRTWVWTGRRYPNWSLIQLHADRVLIFDRLRELHQSEIPLENSRARLKAWESTSEQAFFERDDFMGLGGSLFLIAEAWDEGGACINLINVQHRHKAPEQRAILGMDINPLAVRIISRRYFCFLTRKGVELWHHHDALPRRKRKANYAFDLSDLRGFAAYRRESFKALLVFADCTMVELDLGE